MCLHLEASCYNLADGQGYNMLMLNKEGTSGMEKACMCSIKVSNESGSPVRREVNKVHTLHRFSVSKSLV